MTPNRSWSRGQFALRLNNAGAEFAEICVSTGIVDDHNSAQNWKSFNSIIRAQLTVRVHRLQARNDVLIVSFFIIFSECCLFLLRGFLWRNPLQLLLLANLKIEAYLEMTVHVYGKTDPRSSLFKGTYESNPTETSRLLEDCARITDETEEIGDNIYI